MLVMAPTSCTLWLVPEVLAEGDPRYALPSSAATLRFTQPPVRASAHFVLTLSYHPPNYPSDPSEASDPSVTAEDVPALLVDLDSGVSPYRNLRGLAAPRCGDSGASHDHR